MKTNVLYYGDNLSWLRDHDLFPKEFVDLIYLDPPFNSNTDYNVIFNEPGGEQSQAQISAFDDTWHWEKEASAEALIDLGKPGGKPELVEFIQWLASHGDKTSKSTAAYLSMMAVRLVELYRVLKPTGSLYLHCDPTASHYLKLLLDTIFGVKNFRNEIVWRRTNAKSHAFTRFASNHDVILRYSKTDKWTWNPQYTEHDPEYIKNFYKYTETETGRQYRLSDLTNPNKNRPRLTYEFLGVTRVWRWTKERMQKAYDAGLIVQNKPGQVPSFKRYLDEQEGNPIDDIWDDVPPIQAQASERLGYETQKPLALLERIIRASSNEGDIILDPFCGCGTTIIASQKLKRNWVGIDVTWLAMNKVEQRLHQAFGDKVKSFFTIKGNPTDVASAKALAQKSKKEFEIWALSLVEAAQREHDGGVDGILSIHEGTKKYTKVIVQVKGGEILNPGMVRDLIGTLEKEKAAIGLFITLEEPTRGMKELATHSDSYISPTIGNPSFPRIQIRTIGELLDGEGFNLPYAQSPVKKATPIRKRQKTERLL